MATILLASDDLPFLETMEPVLTASGHDMHVCHDGVSACECAAQIEPALCFVDAGLPVFNGIDTATRLRADPDIPHYTVIVLISPTDMDPRIWEQAGINRCIGRNIEAKALIELVENALPQEARA